MNIVDLIIIIFIQSVQNILQLKLKGNGGYMTMIITILFLRNIKLFIFMKNMVLLNLMVNGVL